MIPWFRLWDIVENSGNIHIYIYIYIHLCIYILYMYIYIYMYMIVYVYHWRMVPPCPFGRRTNSLRNPLGLALKHDETPSQGWEDFTWLIGTCHHAHVSDSRRSPGKTTGTTL